MLLFGFPHERKTMKRKYIIWVLGLILLFAAGTVISQQAGKIQFKAGGNYVYVQSGGTIAVKSGGIQDFESGSYLKIAGTAMTASAAEVNLIDGSIAGTAVGSKALALNSSREVNYFGVSDTLYTNTALIRVTTGSTIDVESGGTLKIAGSAVSASATELNYIDGTILGTAVASKALGLGSSREANYLSLTDTLYTDSALIRVTTGSTLDVETGGAFKIAGTAVTASAAELNYTDGVTLGTAALSKFLGIDASREVNYFGVSDTLYTNTALIRVTTGSTLDVESGGALKIAGTAVSGSADELNYIDGTILGTAVASKALGLGASRDANYFAVTDTLYTDSALVRVTTGSTLQIDSGGAMTINGSPVTTSNLWTGAEGVVALLADSTLMSYTSGKTYIARPVASKATATLPTGAAGLNYSFFVADTDSLRVAAAGSDSLIDNTGAAWKTTTSVAGSVKCTFLDATGKWFMMYPVGTWTSY